VDSSFKLSPQFFFRDFSKYQIIQAGVKAAEPDLEQIVYKRKKQSGKRDLDFSKLPMEQVVYELPEEERVCPVCGGAVAPDRRQAYCSEACALKAHRRQQREYMRKKRG